MAKKGFGKLIAFAAITGAAAGAVSYALRYKMFHSELEKDFREFEDGGDDFDEDGDEPDEAHTVDPRRTDRNYIALHASKDEFKLAAKDMAEATKNVLKDASAVISDTAHEAVSAAVDTAHIAISAVKTKRDELKESLDNDEEDDSDLFEDEGFLDDDYVDEDDLYDYTRTESDEIPAWKKPAEEKTEAAAPSEPTPAPTPAPEEEKADLGAPAEPVKVTIEEDTL